MTKIVAMRIFVMILIFLVSQDARVSAQEIESSQTDSDYTLPNIIAPLDYVDYEVFKSNATEYIPVADDPFLEHVRASLTEDEEEIVSAFFEARQSRLDDSGFSNQLITSIQESKGQIWVGTAQGLFTYDPTISKLKGHENYGIDGPLASHITDIAQDSKGNLWFGTPLGISRLDTLGNWNSIRGSEGLPVEDVTALTVDRQDNIWIGTTQGAIFYKPEDAERKWYYRAGKRYLTSDDIKGIEISEDGKSIYFLTGTGISKLELRDTKLSQKADVLEMRVKNWHRRRGLVAASQLDDAENPSSYSIPDNDNDGLWTAYHVVAMSLAYATTGDRAFLESAREGMHALIMLQNASGVPGLTARSVVPISQRAEMSEQWRETPDGELLWKSDTSSDEIDGHFMAFYVYWEHIARYDPVEAKLIKKQTSELIDYLVDNNYQLIDWDGERTTWGFWNPEALNDDPENYLESGLNSAQMLSFLKVSYHITGIEKYREHYDKLIKEHRYLENLLTMKKLFPDSDNHSDNQLGYVALYPLIQLEHDPQKRNAIHRATRRHYWAHRGDNSAFFAFVTASIDPDYVDIKAAIENLQEIPTDRRQWPMINSNRKDIRWSPNKSRKERRQLDHLLPADERNFDRWNRNIYYADGGRGGDYEDDGGSWLLAYWMGRYHGFIRG